MSLLSNIQICLYNDIIFKYVRNYPKHLIELMSTLLMFPKSLNNYRREVDIHLNFWMCKIVMLHIQQYRIVGCNDWNLFLRILKLRWAYVLCITTCWINIIFYELVVNQRRRLISCLFSVFPATYLMLRVCCYSTKKANVTSVPRVPQLPIGGRHFRRVSEACVLGRQ